MIGMADPLGTCPCGRIATTDDGRCPGCAAKARLRAAHVRHARRRFWLGVALLVAPVVALWWAFW